MDSLRMMNFWNETNEILIKLSWDPTQIKPNGEKLNKGGRHSCPTFLKKCRVETILSRGLPRFKGTTVHNSEMVGGEHKVTWQSELIKGSAYFPTH